MEERVAFNLACLFVSHTHLTARIEIKLKKWQIGAVVGKSRGRGCSMSFVFGLTWAAGNFLHPDP